MVLIELFELIHATQYFLLARFLDFTSEIELVDDCVDLHQHKPVEVKGQTHSLASNRYSEAYFVFSCSTHFIPHPDHKVRSVSSIKVVESLIAKPLLQKHNLKTVPWQWHPSSCHLHNAFLTVCPIGERKRVSFLMDSWKSVSIGAWEIQKRRKHANTIARGGIASGG